MNELLSGDILMSDQIEITELVLSKEVAAQMLGITTRTLENMVSRASRDRKEYPWVKRTNGRSWIIIAPKFRAWLLEDNKVPSKPSRKSKYSI